MEHVYASIDIGSDTIKIIVCELFNNHLNLLAATSTPSKGITKGLITDPRLAKDSIIKALKDTEAMLGVRIKKIIATVPSHFAGYKLINGEVSTEGDLITGKDITNAYKEGIKKELTKEEEFVTVVPIDFKINGRTIIKDPKGFPGKTLTGRAMMVTVPKKNIYSVASIIESLGVELSDISIGSIGDISAFKTKELDESVSAIINIGGDMTTVSLYNKGIPVNTKIIGVGGKEIDKDISYMFQIQTDEAKKIKEHFALAHTKNASKNDFYETNTIDKKPVKISQNEVSEIVMARINEILSLAKKELDNLTNKKIEYTIVTGGVSNMRDFEYCLNDKLVTSKKGNIKLIGLRDNKYSTVIGSIIYFLNTLKLKGMDYTMLSEEDMDKMSSPDRLVDNDETVLGKVFGYFFGE